jgi:hypothetical protein
MIAHLVDHRILVLGGSFDDRPLRSHVDAVAYDLAHITSATKT